VRNVYRSASDAAIANAILPLAKSLNLTVTAEGIERAGQLEWLRERGGNEVQGYLLAEPITAAALEQRFLSPLEARDRDALAHRAESGIAASTSSKRRS
jgi:EAL domain-containing protein (putative c-di-GMP-specific phosphodiesterase class I)